MGRKLVEGVIADARAAGASLKLDVLRENPARRLYEGLGLVVRKEGLHSCDGKEFEFSSADGRELVALFSFNEG